ncbi:MAG: hypothetical protein J5779_02465 [Clostridia bacterium]|nr:hypothetical protein [Clostridia bacterium]
MLEKILPSNLSDIINSKINSSLLNEIRFRTDRPIVVFESGKPYFLAESGLTTNIKEALTCNFETISSIVFRASECSIYAVNEQIKNGFITIENGFRLGLCGTAVIENNQLKTIKNFFSLNLRIPHLVNNCSLNAFCHIIENGKMNNTLIISPPGAGKTTFLKDFVNQMSERNYSSNVLIIDERGEIAGVNENGKSILKSNFIDVLSFMPKSQAINFGIRALCPNLIVTDEIATCEDIEALFYAGNCGVNIMATIHASSIEELKNKEFLKDALSKKLFSRYILLSSSDGPGTYEGIFDENFNRLLRP